MDLSQSFKKNDLSVKSPTNGIVSNYSTINNNSKHGSINFNNIYDKVFSSKSKSPSVSTKTFTTETKSNSYIKDMFEDINQKYTNTKNVLFDLKPSITKEEKHIKNLQMKNNLMKYIPSYTENNEDKSKVLMKNEFDSFKSKYFTTKEETTKNHNKSIKSFTANQNIFLNSSRKENSYIFSEKKLSIMTLIKHKPELTLSPFSKLQPDTASLLKEKKTLLDRKSKDIKYQTKTLTFNSSNKLKNQNASIGFNSSNSKLNNFNFTKSQNAISKMRKDLNI